MIFKGKVLQCIRKLYNETTTHITVLHQHHRPRFYCSPHIDIIYTWLRLCSVRISLSVVLKQSIRRCKRCSVIWRKTKAKQKYLVQTSTSLRATKNNQFRIFFTASHIFWCIFTKHITTVTTNIQPKKNFYYFHICLNELSKSQRCVGVGQMKQFKIIEIFCQWSHFLVMFSRKFRIQNVKWYK